MRRPQRGITIEGPAGSCLMKKGITIMEEYRRCWCEINLEAIRQNLLNVRGRIGGARLLAVIKANGYGHGAVEKEAC